MGGEHVRGDTTYFGDFHTAEIRGGEILADFGTWIGKAMQKYVTLQEQEAELCLEGTELEGCREPKKQAWNLLGEESNHGTISGSFIAAPTAGNGIAAARMRHFKMDSGVGDPTEKGLKSLNYAAAKLSRTCNRRRAKKDWLRSCLINLSVKPEIFKSGKWSKERFLDGLRKAGVSTTDTLPKRSFQCETERGFGEEETQRHHFSWRWRCHSLHFRQRHIWAPFVFEPNLWGAEHKACRH